MKRDRSMDLMKCILVIGMITAHVIQFFGYNNTFTTMFSDYINMITFSGFLFCFGYVCNIAYMKKEKSNIKKKMILNATKMLIAFYISGICFEIFVNKAKFDLILLLKIILLSKIPGYSEFLISFAILNLLTYILFNQIKKVIKSKYIIIVIIISTMFTFFPYDIVKYNQIGLIIGTTQFSCFPVLQYISFYLLGMYFEENKIGLKIEYLLIAIISSSFYIIYQQKFNQIPGRFPPTLIWILSPAIYIYMYYLICKKITIKYKLYNWVNIIGQNTLTFLLSSNIIIFLIKYYIDDIKFGTRICLLISILIIIFTYLLIQILNILLNKIKKIYNQCYQCITTEK